MVFGVIEVPLRGGDESIRFNLPTSKPLMRRPVILKAVLEAIRVPRLQ